MFFNHIYFLINVIGEHWSLASYDSIPRHFAYTILLLLLEALIIFSTNVIFQSRVNQHYAMH